MLIVHLLASSNHLLLFLDPSEPQTPTKESPENTAGSTSATSIRSFKSALEQPIRSPHPIRETPEMESFKRKLSVARRPETGNRDMIRELNQYKVNNAALQKQIESLMAKLNQSKKNERSLTTTLEKVEKNCNEWQEKASKAEQLEKSTLALQNTIDHLEHRLEMANAEKLDAEEQILNLQSGGSPFDRIPPKLRVPEQSTMHVHADQQTAHMSMSTVFSSGSPTSHSPEVQDSSTLAAFISHIERLQEQIKQKDTTVTELERESERLRRNNKQLEHEHKELSLQLDIQGRLLVKTTDSEAHIAKLHAAIIDRESTIGEREKSLHRVERQLEHHKMLLHAEIRRHATMSLLANVEQDPLPGLSSLASKEDIDRWVARLRARLRKEKPQVGQTRSPGDLQSLVDDLRQEIDFYVREIIYYKLDIKGYKSDIKKLKHFAARIGSYGNRASDVESPTPSQGLSVETPSRLRFSSGTPGPGNSSTSSPLLPGPTSLSVPVTCPGPDLAEPDSIGAGIKNTTVAAQKRQLHEPTPITPRTPPFRTGVNVANEVDSIDPGISPRSVARLSPERRKPTVSMEAFRPLLRGSHTARQPPSPDQEKFGDMATNFPLSTPAAPKRHDTQRSVSESIIQLYSTPRTPERSPHVVLTETPNQASPKDDKNAILNRKRSASAPDPNKDKATPERPPRPRFGLYEISAAVDSPGVRTPPRKDVMAEALRNSPERVSAGEHRSARLDDSQNAVNPTLVGLSNSHLSRTNSAGSATAVPAPLTLRSRAGSAASSTIVPASPPRKLSSASSNHMPFIIGMPSPHNPALISPMTTLPPTTCSITGKSASPTTALAPSAMKIHSPTSLVGVGGTMASSTPVTSPIDIPEALAAAKHGHGYFPSSLPVAKGPSQGSSAIHNKNNGISDHSNTHANTKAGNEIVNNTRTMSLAMPSRRDRANSENTNTSGAGGRSAGHSRNVSASSIRSAMQLPSALMKGKGKARKDSISLPRPLDSPFDIDRGNGVGVDTVGRAI